MYKIANYLQLYNPTNTKGGELVYAKYVKLPIKPRGKGLRALLSGDTGLEIFAIWCLLLQAATETSTPSMRGMLLNHKDQPANVEEIADSISLENQKDTVENALDVLVDFGWLELSEDTDVVRSDSVPDTDKLPPKDSVVGADAPPHKLTKAKDKLSEPKGDADEPKDEQCSNTLQTQDEHTSNIPPTTKTKTKSNNKETLELMKLALEFDEKTEKLFGPLMPNERVTFRNIRLYLQTLDLEAMKTAIEWIGTVKIWGDDHEKDNIEVKKCYVSKIKKLGWKP